VPAAPEAPGEPAGVVFNIQRHSIHDGPGIRTVVFLKGCPMRCLWCSNPESQSFQIETQVDPRTGRESLVGRERSVTEVVHEVLRDRPYYRQSGGGVTLSGGEPLAQIRFAEALLAECYRQNVHTAVETAGGVPWAHVQRVLPSVELFLWDLKHPDDAAHERIVGMSNALVLSNLQRLAQTDARFWVRLPLVPGMNADAPTVEQTAAFIASLARRPEIVHLMPFHQYGSSKYQALGKAYALEGVDPLVGTESDPEGLIQASRRILEAHGLRVQVGG
jgi:pyruvate formate lyase activating enzyme